MPLPTAVRLTWPQVRAFWSHRQLTGPDRTDADAATLAAHLCGVHAQYRTSAALVLGVRNPALTPRHVDRALAGELVKTWAMRGTLHLLAAADLPLYVAAARTRNYHREPRWLKENKVSPADVEAVLDAVPAALRGACLTRDELAAAVAERTGRPALRDILRNGFGELLKPVAFAGGLCFGPNRGREVTFRHPRDVLPGPWREPEPGAALVEVLLRYLRAYGPAAPPDIARWWGGTKPATAADLLADHTVEVTIGDRPALALPEQADAVAGAAAHRAVRLLPAFDPHVVAAPRDVAEVLDPGRKTLVYRFAGLFAPVLMVGGRIAGTWRHERRAGRLDIEVDPFDRPDRHLRDGVAAEADVLGTLLDARPRTRIR